MNHKSIKRRSLRTLLILWFLVFAILPLALMTAFSIFKIKSIAEKEFQSRVEANFREVSTRFRLIESRLKKIHSAHMEDNSLKYNLVNQDNIAFSQLLKSWVSKGKLAEISIFAASGKASASVKSGFIVYVKNQKELSETFLSQDFLNYIANKDTVYTIDLLIDNSIEFIAISKILTPQKILIGYLRETIVFTSNRIRELSENLSAEILLSKEGSNIIVSSLKKTFSKINSSSGLKTFPESENNKFSNLSLNGKPYYFINKRLFWDNETMNLSIGVSKEGLLSVLDNINYVFLGMLGVVIFLMIFLSLLISKILLKPLRELVEIVNSDDPGSELINLPVLSDDEIGQLRQSFNKMFSKVYLYQNQLKENIFDLKKSNADIVNTQSQVVQTAKMASLGQLVAGVAHELNNPIGFIHSNMGHLREYSESLIRIIESQSSAEIEEIKKQEDYQYLIKDLPKLIQSCEDGAKRTRDIVLGLRNFSRIEEAQKKEVNLHDGIESTLRLLQSQFKNRIIISKKYANLPLVYCYPSQLNQVFMNILSNSAQAIEGDGKINITTKINKQGTFVEVIIDDNGVGMPLEIQEKIFDPFFTTKPPGVGTGLGLSISYGIVEKHGGQLSVKSEVNQGTSFSIQIPVHPPLTKI